MTTDHFNSDSTQRRCSTTTPARQLDPATDHKSISKSNFCVSSRYFSVFIFFFWFLLLSLLSVCSLACCCSFTHVYSIYKSRELTSADLRKQYWWWELQPGGRLAAADESLPRPDGCFSEPFYSPREYWLPHWQLIGSVEFTTVARKTLVAWTGMRLEMLNIVQQWPPYVVVWCCVCCVCCVQKQIANREQKER